ncbi:hypothetical protein F5Y18DRAFT_430407 [Xylariaceae sp. FL1019]|nr:hypothetical protein F5Y18DRAFT_430407 [Xylariaceae sp. FL1019]
MNPLPTAETTPKRSHDSKKQPPLPILVSQRKWDIGKLTLRSFSMLLCVVELAELIALVVSGNSVATGYHASRGFPALALILFWDVLELVVIIVRRDISNGIHPGAHVGVELVFWIGSIATTVLIGATANVINFVANPGWLKSHDIYAWTQVALTSVAFLVLISLIRFVFFVRACVEVDRRKKDLRVMELVLAIQELGQNPQDYPLETFTQARNLDSASSARWRAALSETLTQNTPRSDGTLQRPRSAPETARNREFEHKYNLPLTTPELMESGVHPEDARNQKVLIGAFPR